MKETLDRFGDIIKSGVPLGRIGSPEDVVGTCIFLCARAGEYVNGAIIPLDGGMSIKKSAKMHNKMSALNLLADYFGIRDDFNKARATLRRYGINMVEDLEQPLGWRIEPYAANRSNP